MNTAATRRLLKWFARHRRDMPWRERRTPYRVWVSEVMLQQTRVDQMEPYYLRFMRRFPSLKKLAEAPLDDVLKCWEGLGYYTRARQLHRTAKIVCDQYRGRFPRDIKTLERLPGLGPYTAAAVACLAMGADEPMVDGNVIRVVSRLIAACEPADTAAVRRRIRAFVSEHLPRGRGGDFNEAMMELGALVCTPSGPSCEACPLESVCVARMQGRPEAYPVRRAARPLPHKIVGAAVIRDRRGRMLIARRREQGMLGGLWEFPGGTVEPGESMPECIRRELYEEMRIRIEVDKPLIVVHHAYSHFTIDLHAWHARILRGRPHCVECSDYAWVTMEEIQRYAFSRADLKIIEALKAERGIRANSD